MTTIAILAYDSCSAWITAGLLELFGIANLAAKSVMRHKPASIPRFDCHLLGRKRRIQASQGVTFSTRTPARRYDAVIAPPLWSESKQDFEHRMQRLQPEHELLRQLSRRTKIMASACSGGVLLANAGLLEGRRATICWWLVGWFRLQFPDINLVPDRLVVRDRDRWTAAAGSAYMHLGLELVREFAGPQVAAATARLMLVERRRGSQSPFIAPPAPAQPDADADMSRALRYIDEHAATPLTIAQLCRAISINERTLARKFQAAVGMPPLSYLQSRRMARARQLLENSSLPLERIVEQCGYEDISSFRKLFSRHVGMTPREYRSRFGG